MSQCWRHSMSDLNLAGKQAPASAAELAACMMDSVPRSFVAVYDGGIIAALVARPLTQVVSPFHYQRSGARWQ